MHSGRATSDIRSAIERALTSLPPGDRRQALDWIEKTAGPTNPHARKRPQAGGSIKRFPWLDPRRPLAGLGGLDWRDAGPSSAANAAARDAWGSRRPDLVREASLPFFSDAAVKLLHGVYLNPEGSAAYSDAFVLAPVNPAPEAVGARGRHRHLLDWQGSSLIEASRRTRFALAEAPLEYVKIFSSLTGSEHGRFVVVDEQLRSPEGLGSLAWRDPSHRARRRFLDNAKSPRLEQLTPDGQLRYAVSIVYAGDLFDAVLLLAPNGVVTMESDRAVLRELFWQDGS